MILHSFEKPDTTDEKVDNTVETFCVLSSVFQKCEKIKKNKNCFTVLTLELPDAQELNIWATAVLYTFLQNRNESLFFLPSQSWNVLPSRAPAIRKESVPITLLRL